MFWHVFQKNLLHELTRHRGEADQLVVPRVLLIIVFKNECDVSIFQSLGTLPDCHDFSYMVGSGNYISQFHQDSGMYLVGSHDLLMFSFLRWSQMCYSPVMGDLIPPVSVLIFKSLGYVGREIIIKNWAKKLWSTSAFFMPFVTRSHVLFTRG